MPVEIRCRVMVVYILYILPVWVGFVRGCGVAGQDGREERGEGDQGQGQHCDEPTGDLFEHENGLLLVLWLKNICTVPYQACLLRPLLTMT